MARQHQFPRVFSDHAHKAIGILGGSFNPAHDGHAHIADMAAQALGLDEIWWLVSPQNPLKSSADMASFEDRFNSALAVASHCKAASIMRISALEHRLGLTVTYKTLSQLRQRVRSAHLVWIMGGDNLLSFHHWARPEMIARSMAIAVVNRPGSRHLRSSPGAKIAGMKRSPRQLRKLGFPPKHWCYIQGRQNNQSATKIRSERST